MGLSVVLFLGIQYECYDIPISGIYLLPYLFGKTLAAREFMWPQIPIHIGNIDYKWNILGYEVLKMLRVPCS